jgi:hypothetical protein
MPKRVADYNNSCIYKLVHKEDFDNENIYIGSTTNFIKRKYMHKNACNNESDKRYNLKLYQFIRDNGGWDNWVMVQIEPYSCNSKKELETKERYWIETLKSKLNCFIPTRTYAEYYNDNKEKILEKNKQYNIDNRDKLVEYQKEYRIYNKDKAKQYRIDNRDKLAENIKQYNIDNRDKIVEYQKKYYIDNKEKAKQYYQNNKEKAKQYYQNNKEKAKQKYQDNKDKILDKTKQKVKCDKCGCEVRKNTLIRHKRSQKCINFNSK